MSEALPSVLNFPALGELLLQQERDDAGPMPLPLVIRGLVPQPGSVAQREEFLPTLCSNALLMRVQRLSGCEPLLPDPHLCQGGWLDNDGWPRCRQSTARDHPETGLPRVLELLLCTSLWAELDPGDAVLLNVAEPLPPRWQAANSGPLFLFPLYGSPRYLQTLDAASSR